MARYSVQFVIIREVVVDSDNDIQAEQDAFATLARRDKDCVIALGVLEEPDMEGALKEDLSQSWAYAIKNFNSGPYFDREAQ